MAEAIAAPEAVLVRERETRSGHRIGFAQLNAEQSLNALTLDMIRRLDAALRRWANDERIVCVVLSGAGEKAFCAGGDVRSLRSSIEAQNRTGRNREVEAFFGEEYRLDYRIHTYAKPVLVWGTGIVMGGGLGLMAGASHRVVTERSRIAMPEVSIGLFPDVGGGWFLPRMPGRTGLYLALTGASLTATDALAVGLADFLLKAADREALLEHLMGVAWTHRATENRAQLSRALRSFAGRGTEPLPTSNVRAHADEIQQLTQGDSLAEVYAQITGYRGADPWLKRGAASLASGSPTSASLVWEIWRRAKHLSLAEAFRMELVVAVQCCRHPDFAEGVRAALIDKDNEPHWTPPKLEEVSEEWIEEHFKSPWANEAHPLAAL